MQPPPRRLEWILVVVLLGIAALFRLGWPEISEFKRDEAQLYALALDVAEGHWHWRGIGSSVGFPNSPVSVYVFAIPLLLWKSPLAATLWVGALNTLAVALAYLIARRYLGVTGALVTLAAYAVSPWGVIFARKIWAQNLLPPFALLHLLTGTLAFVEGRRRWLAAHLVTLAVTAQIHYAAFTLIPVTALAWWRCRQQVDWRMAGLGAGLAALTALPFAAYLAGRALSVTPGEFTALPARWPTLSAQALEYAGLILTGWQAYAITGEQVYRDLLAVAPDLTAPGWVWLGLMAVGAGAWGWQAWRNRPAFTFQALWLTSAALPVLAFVPQVTPVYPHYFIHLMPLGYLLMGAGAASVWAGLPRWRPLWVTALAVSVAAQAGFNATLWPMLAQRATPGAFGLPLHYLLAVAEAAPPGAVILSADPDMPTVLGVLMRGKAPRFAGASATAVFPAQDSVVLWPEATLAVDLYNRWQTSQRVIPLRHGEGAVRVLAGGPPPAPPRPLAASALLASGAEVLGVNPHGSAVDVWWQVSGVFTTADVTWFVHALDDSGQRTAQADAPTYLTSYWRVGDVVLTQLPLAGPARRWRLGQYAALTHEPFPVLDVAGQPAAPWLEVDVEP